MNATPDGAVYAHFDEKMLIPLETIEWCDWNKRRFDKTRTRNVSLIESNARIGIQTPALGRPHPDPEKRKAGIKVQGVAGQRRFESSKVAGREVLPMIVRDMTDEEAHEITIIENIEREDYEPWEEAEAVKDLMDLYDGDVEKVGERLNKAPHWVAQRVQLLSLKPEWLEAWKQDPDDGASVIARFTTAHMIPVARMPVEVQDVLFELCQNGLPYFPTAKDWAEQIGRKFTNLLHAAPWRLDDAALVPEAGACSVCPARSSCQKSMFPEYEAIEGSIKKDDRCLKPSCWEKKATAFVKAKEDELRQKHGMNLVLITESYKEAEQDGFRHADNIVPKARKDGGVPALYRDGSKAGRVTYIDGAQDSYGREVAQSKKEKAAKPTKSKSPDELREQLRQRRRVKQVKLLVDEIVGCFEKNPETGELVPVTKPMRTPPFDTVARMAAVFGTGRSKNWLDQGDWRHYEQALAADMTWLADQLWVNVREVLRGRLAYHKNVDVDLLCTDAKNVAAMLGIDWDSLWDEACAAVKPPKALVNESAGATTAETA